MGTDIKLVSPQTAEAIMGLYTRGRAVFEVDGDEAREVVDWCRKLSPQIEYIIRETIDEPFVAYVMFPLEAWNDEDFRIYRSNIVQFVTAYKGVGCFRWIAGSIPRVYKSY